MAKGLAGWRVLAFESRREPEMEKLLTMQGAKAFVAPILREAPTGPNAEIEEFRRQLAVGELDGVIALTGVSLRHLMKTIEPAEFVEGLSRVKVAARGPKPLAVLRELGVEVAVKTREPHTWREVLEAVEGVEGKRWGVIEYGRPDERLLEGLSGQGREVCRVSAYGYALPEDLGPAREAVARLMAGEVDAIVFTSSAQFSCLEELAGVGIREAMRGVVVASIGPTMTETLEAAGVQVDLEAVPSKMGVLVHQLAEWCEGKIPNNS